MNLFHPDRAAGRMIGMGDLQSLLEKADEKIKRNEKKSLELSLMSGRMTLQDFADQMTLMGKLGSLSQIAKYIPGLRSGQVHERVLF